MKLPSPVNSTRLHLRALLPPETDPILSTECVSLLTLHCGLLFVKPRTLLSIPRSYVLRPGTWSFSHASFFCIRSDQSLSHVRLFVTPWIVACQASLSISNSQNHSSKASILRLSAFFTVQLSHPYMTTGKTIALTRRTFVGKVISLLLNMLSRLVMTTNKHPQIAVALIRYFHITWTPDVYHPWLEWYHSSLFYFCSVFQ